MNKIILFCFLLVLSCTKKSEIELKVREIMLPNGMVCLMVRRPGPPLFSSNLSIKVGSIDEPKGVSGIAHFFEHMAFKGTPTIGTKDYAKEKIVMEKMHAVGTQIVEKRGKEDITVLEAELAKLQKEHSALIEQNEFVKIFQRNGQVSLNATTDTDYTNYFISLPLNKLELWAYLESERLIHPVYREFYKERNVVAEERRMRTDNNPDGRLYEQFLLMAFDENPYRIPVVGFENEIPNYTLQAATQFRKENYVPSRMVLSLVGDLDFNYTEQILTKYFGRIPSGEKEKSRAPYPLPKDLPRRKVIPGKEEPRMYMGFHRPTYPHPSDEVFDVIERIMCQGRTSRLYSKLVNEKKIASNVECYAAIPGGRLDSLFTFYGTPLPPHTNDEVLTSMMAEISELKETLVDVTEVEKVRNQIEAELLWSMKSNMGLAKTLSFYKSLTGDWRYIYNVQKKIKSVTPEMIRDVVKTYFNPERQVTLFMEKT